MDIIVLRQIWKTVQAVTRNSDDFYASCNRTIFKVWSDNVEHSSFKDLWMARNRTGAKKKPLKSVSYNANGGRKKILLWTKNICNMETFNPLNASSSSQPGERHQDIIRQSHNITMSINESSLILLFLGIQHWHQQRWLHINSSMKMEDSRKTILNCVIQGSVFRWVGFYIIEISSGRTRRLLE